MGGQLPERFRVPVERLTVTEEWEALGELVAAFGPCRIEGEADRPLAWLAFFAVRRALICWDLYSDGKRPHQALEVVRGWLVDGRRPERWEPFTEAAQPSYLGRRIIDCTYSDTMPVSEASAALARFCQGGDPAEAREALDGAEEAFRSSPLWHEDHFRRWLAEVALPAAICERELSAAEQHALREYDAGTIAHEKNAGGMRPITEGSPEFLRKIIDFFRNRTQSRVSESAEEPYGDDLVKPREE